MFRRVRRVLLVLSVVTVLAGAVVAVSATPALAYGKANWQTTLHGTFNYPGTGFGFGFWGWCAFAGGVTSGNSGDCQLEEYMHAPAGTGWNCHLSIDVTRWDQSASDFGGNTFHIDGSATVKPASLPASQTEACVTFFTNQPFTGTSFTGVDTFIPAAPGHYNFADFVTFLGAVGAFGFQVNQIP
jgi:hypothetical protein